MLTKIIEKGKAGKKSLLANFLIFGLAKSCVFFAPLLLSQQLSLAHYGIFEYALSLGLILYIFINMGIPASYPYYILKKRRIDLLPTFLFHNVLLCICGIIYGLLYFLKIIPSNEVTWIVCITLLLSNVFFISTIFKTHARVIKAVILDSIHYVLITVLCIASYLLFFKLDFVLLHCLWLLYFSLCLYFFIIFKRHFSLRTGHLKENYRLLIGYGFPAILTSLLIGMIVGSGRILIKHFLSEETVGIYSFYFRLAGGIILIHQFVSVSFFKKIFTTAKENLDKYFSLFFAGLLIVNIVLFFIIPDLLVTIFPLLKNYTEYKLLYWMVSIQMIIWIALAMNENLIYRENLTKSISLIFMALIGAGMAVLYMLSRWYQPQLEQLVIFHVSFLFLAVEAQYILLKRKEINLIKCRLINYLAYFLIVCVFCISN